MVEEGKEPTTPEGYWHFVLDPMNTFYCRVLRQVSGAPLAAHFCTPCTHSHLAWTGACFVQVMASTFTDIIVSIEDEDQEGLANRWHKAMRVTYLGDNCTTQVAIASIVLCCVVHATPRVTLTKGCARLCLRSWFGCRSGWSRT